MGQCFAGKAVVIESIVNNTVLDLINFAFTVRFWTVLAISISDPILWSGQSPVVVRFNVSSDT